MGQLALLMDQKRESPVSPEQLIADELRLMPEVIGPGFDNFDNTLKQLIQKHGFELQKTRHEEFIDPGPLDTSLRRCKMIA